MVEEYKLRTKKAGPDHPTNIYGSQEDDNLAVKTLSRIVITDEQSRESYASEIVESLDKLSEVSLKTIEVWLGPYIVNKNGSYAIIFKMTSD